MEVAIMFLYPVMGVLLVFGVVAMGYDLINSFKKR